MRKEKVKFFGCSQTSCKYSRLSEESVLSIMDQRHIILSIRQKIAFKRMAGGKGELGGHLNLEKLANFHRILPKVRQFLLKSVLSRAICSCEPRNFG